jgi:polyhydroxyalkanoate synthesis regulator phasin
VLAENRRALISAEAQERVDRITNEANARLGHTTFALDTKQSELAGLDIAQRRDRTADTPQGMVQRARAIQDNLLPALAAQVESFRHQTNAMWQVGDEDAARQAHLNMLQAGNDLASAMVDAGELMRQAAQQAAQDLVDTAAHGTTMADLGRTKLELEQRIAGTYDTGAAGQQRADYINAQYIPRLQAELAALMEQQKAARETGDPKLAEQVAEAIAGKQNSILEATLAATQEVAANTDELRETGGSLGFSSHGQVFGDRRAINAGISA